MTTASCGFLRMPAYSYNSQYWTPHCLKSVYFRPTGLIAIWSGLKALSLLYVTTCSSGMPGYMWVLRGLVSSLLPYIGPLASIGRQRCMLFLLGLWGDSWAQTIWPGSLWPRPSPQTSVWKEKRYFKSSSQNAPSHHISVTNGPSKVIWSNHILQSLQFPLYLIVPKSYISFYLLTSRNGELTTGQGQPK